MVDRVILCQNYLTTLGGNVVRQKKKRKKGSASDSHQPNPAIRRKTYHRTKNHQPYSASWSCELGRPSEPCRARHRINQDKNPHIESHRRQERVVPRGARCGGLSVLGC